MRIVRISFGFSRMNASEVSYMADEIIKKMADESALYPSPNPALSVVQNAVLELRESMMRASNKDGLMVKIRNDKKVIVENLLKLLASYSINVTGGEKLALEKGGWKIVEKRASVPVIPPTNAKISFIQGKSGVLKLNWDAQKGANFLVEINDKNSQIDSAWRFAGITSKCKIIISGLTPGTIYNFRVFAVRGANKSGASYVVSSMAI